MPLCKTAPIALLCAIIREKINIGLTLETISYNTWKIKGKVLYLFSYEISLNSLKNDS